jgi:asparagine synthase (glutamine-hydrolysing)
MPGIFGITWRVNPAGGSAVLLERMASSMRHHPWYTKEDYLDEKAGLALGRMALGFVNPEHQPACTEDRSILAVLDGEILDADEQQATLERRGHRLQGKGPAALVALGYEVDGPDFFAGLHGKFVAALWDTRHRQLVLVNDRFGMRPLYYAHLGERLLFASEIKALLCDREVSRRPHVAGIAQFFTFGQLLGEDTFYESIRLLPPASCLIYDQAESQVTTCRYWRLEAQCPERGMNRQAALERIVTAFEKAMERCSGGSYRMGLSLSGGLDARTILGTMSPDRPLATLCAGMEGSMDLRCAARLAALTRRKHREVVLDDQFLSRFGERLRDMVRLTDGHYLSQCIVMHTLPVYRELGIEVLLRGHAGELMHMTKAYNFSLDQEAIAAASDAAIEGWLLGHLQAYMLEGTGGQLFASAHRGEMEELARESLLACLRPFRGIHPPVQQVARLFITTRLRRETAMSLVKFGSLVETRLPYLDNEVVDALLAAPIDLKLGEEIQAEILRRRCPALLGVENVNTGAPMKAGRLSRLFGRVRQKVLAKLGVKGYQPYERLGLWLRRELRPLVAEVLLDARCLDRGIFHPQAVRDVIERHNTGHANHTFLILAMMIFETGQRMFADGDDVPAESDALAPTTAASLGSL